jgi:hypothetical protein
LIGFMVQPLIEITRSGKESSLAEEKKRRKDANDLRGRER